MSVGKPLYFNNEDEQILVKFENYIREPEESKRKTNFNRAVIKLIKEFVAKKEAEEAAKLPPTKPNLDSEVI